MDLWKYIYGYVRLTLYSGEVFTGDVLDVATAEATGEREDSLSLEVRPGMIYGFFPSEIKSIVFIN